MHTNARVSVTLGILLAASCCAAQTIDELGDDTNVYNGFTGAGRGNIVDVTTTVELIEIRQSVNLRTVMDLNFVVKHWDVGLGAWTVDMNLLVPAQGPGHPTFWSSGAISHTLLAGERYAIMMYWSGTGDYYNDNTSPVFGPISFGNHFDNAYENSYPPSAYVGTVSQSWIPHQWYVTQSPCPTPADLAVRAVDAVATTVVQGDIDVPVTVMVENPGTGDADTLAVQLSFMGTLDRTAEYTVTPDPANPTTIAAGATGMLVFAVDVDPMATQETITIDASATAVDTLCGTMLADPDADVTDSWDVYDCAATTCGDCNGDGVSSILDALLAAQHAAALTVLVGIDFTNCNVNGAYEPDPAAVVDVLDALTLAQAAAGLVALACC